MSCGGEFPATEFFFGADYYPEQWPRNLWERDVNLMSEARFSVVRLAEFAWAQLEPSPGRFTFDWLDEIIEKLGAKGIKAVLGTPTGTAPPIWFPRMYPEAFPVDDQGHRLRFGNDGAWMFYCPHNPNFLRCIERIVSAMAEHYRDSLNIYGWQIDNEIMWPDPKPNMVCYCDHTKEKFREWLRAKYGSIHELNDKCGTKGFPIQIYDNWEEIDPPWPPLREKNRGLALDWLRFRSDALIEYVRFTASIVRDKAPLQKITTNLVSPHIDNYGVSKLLDFVSYDSYPKHKEEPDPAKISMRYDWFRSMKNAGFWVMELQSGMSAALGKMPRPGEIRKWTYQAIGHGADGILYFRWRTTPYGVEQFWHGILGHDNRPNRRYEEVRKVGEELQALGSLISESSCKSDVAIMFSYDSMWATDIEAASYGRTHVDAVQDVYKGLWLNRVPTDIVEPSCDLTKYRVVFLPFCYIMDRKMALNLGDFVNRGGVLVSDGRLAVKDEYNQVFTEPLPGLLTDLFGITIDDYDIVNDGQERTITGRKDWPILADKEIRPCGWVEHLGVVDADVLATHRGTWMDGKPAVTRRRCGGGEAVYAGTFLSPNMTSLIIEDFLHRGLIKPLTSLNDADVEIVKREAGDFSLLFVINHACTPKKVELPLGRRQTVEIGGQTFETDVLTVALDADDVKVFVLR